MMLVNQDTTALERKIDLKVYELYELTNVKAPLRGRFFIL